MSRRGVGRDAGEHRPQTGSKSALGFAGLLLPCLISIAIYHSVYFDEIKKKEKKEA